MVYPMSPVIAVHAMDTQNMGGAPRDGQIHYAGCIRVAVSGLHKQEPWTQRNHRHPTEILKMGLYRASHLLGSISQSTKQIFPKPMFAYLQRPERLRGLCPQRSSALLAPQNNRRCLTANSPFTSRDATVSPNPSFGCFRK